VSGLQSGTTYWWSVQAIDQEYRGGAFAPEQSFTPPVTGVGDPARAGTARLTARPNPFHGSTTLRLGPSIAPTSIAIFDPTGRMVRRLHLAGADGFQWDGRDDAGRTVPAGLYLVRADDGTRALLGRIVRLR